MHGTKLTDIYAYEKHVGPVKARTEFLCTHSHTLWQHGAAQSEDCLYSDCRRGGAEQPWCAPAPQRGPVGTEGLTFVRPWEFLSTQLKSENESFMREKTSLFSLLSLAHALAMNLENSPAGASTDKTAPLLDIRPVYKPLMSPMLSPV